MSTTPRSRVALPVALATGLAAASLVGSTLFGPAAHAAPPVALTYDGSGAATSSGTTTSLTAGTVTAQATTAYTFSALNPNKTPVRWDPCTAIHYKVNRNGIAPKSELKYVKSAVKKLSKATGIRFVYDGATKDVPDSMNVRTAVKTDLVFAFANRGSGAKKSKALPKDTSVAGIGGMNYVSGDGLSVYRIDEGVVVIRGSLWKKLSRRHRTSLYIHELAHAAGLNHSSKSSQVMYPSLISKSPTVYKKYDKIGLKKLGRTQGCVRPTGTPKQPTVTTSGSNLVVATGAVKHYGKSLKYVLTQYTNAGEKSWTKTTPSFTVPAPADGATYVIKAKDSIGYAYSDPTYYLP